MLHSRISLLNWNSGGMAQGTLFELTHWLKTHPVDLATITETRWSFDRCWHDSNWAYVHSACSEKGTGGVLVMISRALAHPDQIGYDVKIPGRLLQVRIHFQKRALDVIAVYQHVYNRQAGIKDKRVYLWDQLDQTLDSLPHRNQMICSGDFNCSLQIQSPAIGSPHFPWKHTVRHGPAHPDMQRFSAL